MTVSGIRVPGWAVGAVIAGAALIGIGVGIGSRAEAQALREATVDYRLCRIEKALGIEAWQSCGSDDHKVRTR